MPVFCGPLRRYAALARSLAPFSISLCCLLCRMVTAKVWVMKKHFEGFPQTSDFEMKQEVLANLKDGGEWSAIACCLEAVLLQTMAVRL